MRSRSALRSSATSMSDLIGLPVKGRLLIPLDVPDRRASERQLHQVLPPHDLPAEHGLNLVHDLLADPRMVDLRQEVRQHQRLYPGPLRDERVVLVVAARGAIGD